MMAELLVKELPLTVAVPTLSRPPPSVLAELLVKELPLTVAVPLLSLSRPPPLAGGVAGEGAAAHRRRPEVVEAAAIVLAELLVKELPLTVAVPKLSRPPPRSWRSCW